MSKLATISETDDIAAQLAQLARRVEGIAAKDIELRGLLERQQEKLAQAVETLERYFHDVKKAVKKYAGAKDERGREIALHDLGVATEFARQGLPRVR